MSRKDTDKEFLIKKAWKEGGLYNKSELREKSRQLRGEVAKKMPERYHKLTNEGHTYQSRNPKALKALKQAFKKKDYHKASGIISYEL